jgi:hypothetical protein
MHPNFRSRFLAVRRIGTPTKRESRPKRPIPAAAAAADLLHMARYSLALLSAAVLAAHLRAAL